MFIVIIDTWICLFSDCFAAVEESAIYFAISLLLM